MPRVNLTLPEAFGKVSGLVLLGVCLTACGGGSSGGNNDPSDGSGGGANGELEINRENLSQVARHGLDATATVMKLSVQLQEALDSLVISESPRHEFECRGSGTVSLTIESPSKVSVIFNSCNNPELGERFDGNVEFFPNSLFFNRAHEVYTSGRIEIVDNLQLTDRAYSSISGGFNVTLQSTWHGDTLLIDRLASNPITLTNELGLTTIDKFSASLEYDLDEGLNLWPNSDFYGSFDIALNSQELGGRFRCGSVEKFGAENRYPYDFQIFCGGKRDRSILLEAGNNSQIIISLLDPDTDSYDATIGFSWRYFAPLYTYQPGLPQPEVEIESLPHEFFAMPINDAVYSKYTDRIYVVVPADAQEYANHLLELDIQSGNVLRSVPLKGESETIAVSADGSVGYLGYVDHGEVQRIELESLTLTTVLDLGLVNDTWGDQLFALEIAVSPINDTELAIATYRKSYGGIYSAGIVYFKDGVKRDVVRGGGSDPTRLVYDETGSYVVGYDDSSTAYDIDVYTVEDNSLSFYARRNNYANGPSDIVLHDQLLYHGIGTVINPSSGELVGRNKNIYGYTYENNRKLAPLITPDNQHTYILGKYLEVFDKNRFTYLGAFDPKIEGEFLRMFNVSGDRFVVVTDIGIKTFSHGDVPSDLDWQCGFSEIPDPRTHRQIEGVNCIFTDVAYSSERAEIYASIPGAAGVNGNSIAIINSQSLEIEQYIPVGSEPAELEISRDQNRLYVTYGGTNKYSELNLDTLSIIRDVDLGFDPTTGPIFSGDLEPLPDTNNSVLVSMARHGYTTDFAGVAVFTDGLRAPATIGEHSRPAINRVCFISSNLAFGYNNDDSGHQLSELFVDASGVVRTDTYEEKIEGFTNELECSEGTIYSSQGYVIDAATKAIIGRMPGLETDNWTYHQFVVDESRRLLYLYASMLLFENDPVLKVFSLDTLDDLASIKMPAFSVLMSEPKALVNLDNGRLLVVLDNFMYLLNKDQLLPIE